MKVFDIDASIEAQRPRIRLRGKTYALRDITVEERMRLMYSAYNKQKELEDTIEDTEKLGQLLREMISENLQLLLEDFPAEVADSVTQYEYQAIQDAAAKARDTRIDVLEKNEAGAEQR